MMSDTSAFGTATIPPRAGIGLRTPHHQSILDDKPDIGWVEVHAENYFCGGQSLDYLRRARELYPLSLHGVGLSLGSDQPLDDHHLELFRTLIRQTDPGLVSEHTTWSAIDGIYLNDLVPLPRTKQSLEVITSNVQKMQDSLGHQVLMENPSSYLEYQESQMPETEFLSALSDASGCGLLIDINNIYINACNHRFDPWEYMRSLPADKIGEVHVAGHQIDTIDGEAIWVDTHDKTVDGAVWELYRRLIMRCGSIPTLIEWDSDIPDLDVLVAEAHKADAIAAKATSS